MSSMSRRPRWPAHSFGLPAMEIYRHRLNRRSARGKPDGGEGSGDGAADPASRPSESRAKAPAKWLRLNLTGGNSFAALSPLTEIVLKPPQLLEIGQAARARWSSATAHIIRRREAYSTAAAMCFSVACAAGFGLSSVEQVASGDFCRATYGSQQKLPAIYEYDFLVRDGGLMSYGPDMSEVYDRAADLADRILKGARPADLPFEQPTRLRLVINKKTLESLGLTIPAAMLMRADEVVD
jgi:ABC transporter substrate binding protein